MPWAMSSAVSFSSDASALLGADETTVCICRSTNIFKSSLCKIVRPRRKANG